MELHEHRVRRPEWACRHGEYAQTRRSDSRRPPTSSAGVKQCHAPQLDWTAHRLLNRNKERQSPRCSARCRLQGWLQWVGPLPIHVGGHLGCCERHVHRGPRRRGSRSRACDRSTGSTTSAQRLAKLQRNRNTRTCAAPTSACSKRAPSASRSSRAALPAMDHLYDELPNFHEALDDVKRQIALCQDSARRARNHADAAARARPASARRTSRARSPSCSAPAWASSR